MQSSTVVMVVTRHGIQSHVGLNIAHNNNNNNNNNDDDDDDDDDKLFDARNDDSNDDSDDDSNNDSNDDSYDNVIAVLAIHLPYAPVLAQV
eukprot:1032093-Amphidinium_carterae.1